MAEKTVLVVDDEEQVRKTLTKFLKSIGVLDVHEASNGQEGVEKAKVLQASLKLVMLDLKMPVKDGLQTLQEIRQILPTVKAVILTGYPFYGDAESAVKKWGVVDFIVKPVDLDYLERIVSTVLSEP